MGAMKRYAESVSEDMGLDGEVNDDVLLEAQRRLDEAEARRLDMRKKNQEVESS